MKTTRRVPVAAHTRRIPVKASDIAFERTTFELQCFVVGKECERELEQKLAGVSREQLERMEQTY